MQIDGSRSLDTIQWRLKSELFPVHGRQWVLKIGTLPRFKMGIFAVSQMGHFIEFLFIKNYLIWLDLEMLNGFVKSYWFQHLQF